MKPGGANEEPIVSDLTFFVEFAGSMAVVALPIVVLLRLLAAHGASGITDLFMVTGRFDVGAGSPEEETPPRWHLERLAPPRPAATPSEDRAWEPLGESGRPHPGQVALGDLTLVQQPAEEGIERAIAVVGGGGLPALEERG